MAKWLGAVALAAVVALGGPVARPAAAADMNMSGATCSPDGTSLTLTAQNHQFDKTCLAVPAGQPFTIHFDNKDTDRHNVAILPSHMSTQAFFRGDIVPGPKSITYSVPALKPGTWHFHCEIHPNLMNGTFVVAAAAPGAPGTPAAAPKAAPTPPPATSMGAGGGMPVLTPTPTAASAPSPPAAAPAPIPASPAPSRTAAGAAAAAPPATPAGTGKNPLPRTGPASDRLLLVLAGAALALGGLSVAAAARGPRTASTRIPG